MFVIMIIIRVNDKVKIIVKNNVRDDGVKDNLQRQCEKRERLVYLSKDVLNVYLEGRMY